MIERRQWCAEAKSWWGGGSTNAVAVDPVQIKRFPVCGRISLEDEDIAHVVDLRRNVLRSDLFDVTVTWIGKAAPRLKHASDILVIRGLPSAIVVNDQMREAFAQTRGLDIRRISLAVIDGVPGLALRSQNWKEMVHWIEHFRGCSSWGNDCAPCAEPLLHCSDMSGEDWKNIVRATRACRD